MDTLIKSEPETCGLTWYGDTHEHRCAQVQRHTTLHACVVCGAVKLSRRSSWLVQTVPATTNPIGFIPRRDDAVAKWLRTQREKYHQQSTHWYTIDTLLDNYREHADTGTPLDAEVERGKS